MYFVNNSSFTFVDEFLTGNKIRHLLVDKKIKKIITTGPESTGKSTLTLELAQNLQTQYVPEFARTYIESIKRPYREDDLIKIAKGQRDLEMFFLKKSNQFLCCDTSMLVLKIWSEYRFGKCHPWIETQFQKEDGIFILCGIDVPWEFDPQRENPNEREELYQLYLSTLMNYNKKYIEVSGSQELRMMKILSVLEK